MRIRFIFTLFLAVLLVACAKTEKSFSVLIQELPTRIHPYDAGIDYKLYVLKQLYEPLFIHRNDYSFHSNILKSWQSSNNYTTYCLCLKKNITYSNKKQLTLSDLEVNLIRLQDKGIIAKRISSIEMARNCLTIEFSESYIRFPFDMSTYMSAIVDPVTAKGNIVVGVSQYSVKELTPKMIHLKTANKKLTYSDVYFYKWSVDDNKSNVIYKLENIDDFNQLPIEYVPKRVKDEFNAYELPALSTVVMLINTENKKVREIVYNCLNYSELRSIFTPKRKDFNDVGGLLPSGIIGAIEKPIGQRCNFTKLDQLVNLRYIESMRPKSIPALQQYVDEKLLKYNIKVNIEYNEINELAEILLSEKKEYDLTIVGMNSYIPDPYGFYQCFFDSDLLMTKVTNSELALIMQQYLVTDDFETKKVLAMKANKSLIKNYQMIPLYQENRKYYFADNVVNITSDPLFLNYIKISEL